MLYELEATAQCLANVTVFFRRQPVHGPFLLLYGYCMGYRHDFMARTVQPEVRAVLGAAGSIMNGAVVLEPEELLFKLVLNDDHARQTYRRHLEGSPQVAFEFSYTHGASHLLVLHTGAWTLLKELIGKRRYVVYLRSRQHSRCHLFAMVQTLASSYSLFDSIPEARCIGIGESDPPPPPQLLVASADLTDIMPFALFGASPSQLRGRLCILEQLEHRQGWSERCRPLVVGFAKPAWQGPDRDRQVQLKASLILYNMAELRTTALVNEIHPGLAVVRAALGSGEASKQALEELMQQAANNQQPWDETADGIFSLFFRCCHLNDKPLAVTLRVTSEMAKGAQE